MFVARCRINFCNPQKWGILSDFCLKIAQNRGVFSARCPFKSNKRSHSGDDGDEDPPVPIPNTEVKLIYGESSWHRAPARIANCRISIKKRPFSVENGRFSCICIFSQLVVFGLFRPVSGVKITSFSSFFASILVSF